MTQDEAAAAIRKLCPGMGGWADWSALDAQERQVGILEHSSHGPASRLILGRSRNDWDEAVQRAKEKVASWAKPEERKKAKKPDPDELPQEEMPLDPPGA